MFGLVALCLPSFRHCLYFTTPFSVHPLGEGYVLTMGDVGTTSVVKPHGSRPRMEYAPNSVQKRSYRRAVRRALLHGWTWYRGQILTPDHIAPDHKKAIPIDPTETPSPNYTQRHHAKGHKFSCFTGNASGLALDKWDIFQHWISHQDLDLSFL